MRAALIAALALLAAAPPAVATDEAPPRPPRRIPSNATGYKLNNPVYTLMLGAGGTTAISRAPKKIVKAVSGDNGVIEVVPFRQAVPTIGILAKRRGVTNVLVWTQDSQVHTYRITVK